MNPSRVLVVDDEAEALSAVERVLHNEGLQLTTTTSTDEALALLGRENFAVLICDQRMPGMTGTELLEKARLVSPETVRIILTAYADLTPILRAINTGVVHRFLQKPWNDDELKLVIRQALDQHALLAENQRLQLLTARQNFELKELNEGLERKVHERTVEIRRLNQKLEHSFLGSIKLLAELGEMHSPVIGSHSKRVAGLCRDIGGRMGLAGRKLFDVLVAAILHDIGKIGISPDILRQHPVQGEAIVRMVGDLGDAPRLIRHHHESCDGRGYPDRLKRDNIPLGSRIIAAADTYDWALNSRSSFERTTPEQALETVRDCCPVKLDPTVVSALTLCLRSPGRTRSGPAEVDVGPRDLREDMVLSRDLRTLRGILLLPKDTRLKREHILQIRKRSLDSLDAIVDGIYVYRTHDASILSATS